MTLRSLRSTTLTLSLPSSATDSRCRAISTVKWSIRPSTWPSGILASSIKGCGDAARAGPAPTLARASPVRRATRRQSRWGEPPIVAGRPCGINCPSPGRGHLLPNEKSSNAVTLSALVPYADVASACDMCVIDVDIGFAVQKDHDTRASDFDPEPRCP